MEDIKHSGEANRHHYIFVQVKAVNGVISDGFAMTQLPAAMAEGNLPSKEV